MKKANKWGILSFLRILTPVSAYAWVESGVEVVGGGGVLDHNTKYQLISMSPYLHKKRLNKEINEGE